MLVLENRNKRNKSFLDIDVEEDRDYAFMCYAGMVWKENEFVEVKNMEEGILGRILGNLGR